MDIVPGLGLFISAIYQSGLYQGWELYSSVAPEIASEMEDSEEIYNIIYEDIEPAAGSYQNSTNTIRVDPYYIGRTETIAVIIAHETVHSYAEGSASVYEEAVAYQYMYEIGSLLGIDISWHSGVVGDINLRMWYSCLALTADLKEAKEEWQADGRYLNLEGPLPSQETFNVLQENFVFPYIHYSYPDLSWVLSRGNW